MSSVNLKTRLKSTINSEIGGWSSWSPSCTLRCSWICFHLVSIRDALSKGIFFIAFIIIFVLSIILGFFISKNLQILFIFLTKFPYEIKGDFGYWGKFYLDLKTSLIAVINYGSGEHRIWEGVMYKVSKISDLNLMSALQNVSGVWSSSKIAKNVGVKTLICLK